MYRGNSRRELYYDDWADLKPGMVVEDIEGDILKLDRRVPGDGTDWYCAIWMNDHFSYEDLRVHPADIKFILTLG